MKTWMVLLLGLLVLMMAVAPAFADSVMDEVKSNLGTSSLQNDIDRTAANIVTAVRSIAVVAAVIFLIWAGITFWGAGHDPKAIAAAKGQLIYFLVALFFVMGAEKIVGFIYSIFGWQVQ